MDLVGTLRKGDLSRGGQGDFKWSDVQNSSHREHYLGHSLMAPVGRWAKGRDLNWYAKANDEHADGESPTEKAARERKEEVTRIKQAEEDAMARALGLPVPVRNNANMEPVSDKRDIDKVLKETTGMEGNVGIGLGYGRAATLIDRSTMNETIGGNAESQDKELQHALKEYRRRHHHSDRTRRSRSRDRERRHHRSDRDSNREKHRERSGERHHRRRSGSRSPDRSTERIRRDRRRSRSPHRSRKNYDKRN